MVLLGSHGANATKDFTAQQQFVAAMLKKMEVSEDATLLGAVTYGHSPEIKWRIGEKSTKEGTETAVLNLKNPGVKGDVYAALSLINVTLLNTAQGARPNTPKTVLAFVSDNRTKDEDKMAKLVKSFKDRKVKLVVIRFGSSREGASRDPITYDKSLYFAPPSLDELKMKINRVFAAVQPGLFLFIFLLDLSPQFRPVFCEF